MYSRLGKKQNNRLFYEQALLVNLKGEADAILICKQRTCSIFTNFQEIKQTTRYSYSL